jgi:nicotinamide mononucleotide transporter
MRIAGGKQSMISEINEFVGTVLFTVLGYQVTLLELTAVIASATGVWLGTTGKRIMWPWYGFSGVLYGWLFFNYDLYASASLQLVFIGAAIWGWFGWGPQGAQSRDLSWLWRITVLNSGVLAWLVVTPLLISLGAAAARPDAFGLVFSVIAQILMVLQFRENWAVWFVVNVAYVALFWSQDLKFTSLLYVVFAGIALRGWINWQKLQRADSQ